MRKYNQFWLLALLALASCTDYLDINTNPNYATSASAELVLPQAIVGSASVSNAFSSHAAHFAGYMANAGGYSGFGSLLNYNLVPGDYNTIWINSYDNLQDFKYVIDQSKDQDEQSYFKASAMIMTVLNYQRLVDAYNDIPYSEALKSNENLTPKYDDAAAIYQDLVVKLDEAIAVIDNAKSPVTLNPSSDPLFGGNMNRWKQFANTLKLRLLIRISGLPALAAFTKDHFAKIDQKLGFLTEDAIVNPGYVRDRPNPLWNSWGYTPAGAIANSARIPAQFSYGFYKGQKLTDEGRGLVIFKNFATNGTPVNQLGNETNAPTVVTNYSTWYTGAFNSSSSITNSQGIMKGPSQGQPLMLVAESNFLQAEARLRGLIPGKFEENFEQGIIASFTYLYKDVTNIVASGKDVKSDVDKYKTDNEESYLVNVALAKTPAEKLEAIITQKYIALNMINCDEAWNEYRRTGFPVTLPAGDGYHNMASNKSNSTRADKLPSRIMYPSSELSYNSANYKVINPFSDKIFWDPN